MKKFYVSILAMALAAVFAVGLIAAADGVTPAEQEILLGQEMEYEENFFDNSKVHIIDIQVSEADWQRMKLEQAMSKECIGGTVVIDGEPVYNVGVRTKGNSTLFFNSVKGWDRFSLVLEFDAYQENQRFQGLDSVALYNNMFDPSMMKSWLSYEMMRSMGVKTPLSTFVALHLNGEYIGMYSASEMFTESFAVRNFGYEYGNIYKPEHMDIGAIMTGELQNTKINFAALTAEKEDGSSGFTIDSILTCSNDAVRLAYLGESLYDYEDIWRNTSFPIGVSDKERLLQALRIINGVDTGSGDESLTPEDVVDMDALARYFAVNTFLLNTDCYTTGMAHNYGLYEKDGVLTMLPWDYDVGLGNISSEFGVSSATEFINQPIDEPVMGTTVEERPMLKVLMESEEGMALYHQYLDQLLELWMDSGRLAEEVNAMEALIGPWIEKEAEDLRIYTDEEHSQAVESILKFTTYRAESIRGQLDGKIPATAAEQGMQPETLVDCSDYQSPDAGIMKILLPHVEGAEVNAENALLLLPEGCQNMYRSVNLLALLNLIDYGGLVDLAQAKAAEADAVEVSAEPGASDGTGQADGPSDGSDPAGTGADTEAGAGLDGKTLLLATMPYPLVLLKHLLTFLALPLVLIFGWRFVRRWRKKGGIRRVL